MATTTDKKNRPVDWLVRALRKAFPFDDNKVIRPAKPSEGIGKIYGVEDVWFDFATLKNYANRLTKLQDELSEDTLPLLIIGDNKPQFVATNAMLLMIRSGVYEDENVIDWSGPGYPGFILFNWDEFMGLAGSTLKLVSVPGADE